MKFVIYMVIYIKINCVHEPGAPSQRLSLHWCKRQRQHFALATVGVVLQK